MSTVHDTCPRTFPGPTHVRKPGRALTSLTLTAAAAMFLPACIGDVDSPDHGGELAEGSETEASTTSTGEASEDDSNGETEPGLPTLDDDALLSDPDATGVRYCAQQNDCNLSCECYQGQCTPSLWGPPPPAYFCDQPPVRACASITDCRSGCSCSGGMCQSEVFGPTPPPSCHLPPPDTYEYDDDWQSWQAYTGTPQPHNFHTASDNDWVAVYIPYAGNVRFRTYGLTYATDTIIEVYAYTGSLGAVIASNDDIGGAWWDADSRSSRVDIPVAAGSTYLVRVVDKSDPIVYESHELPTYMLEIAYN